MTDKTLKLDDLYALIKEKIAAKENNSYTYELAKAGAEKTTRKVGEEAVEVVVAAFLHEKENSLQRRSDLVGEIGDLFYHTLVLMASQNIELSDIEAELYKRNNK